MEFSLFLNTRGRLTELINLLDSIVETTYDISNIEILINVDMDDVETCEGVQELLNIYPVRIFIIQRPANLHKALNSLAKLTTGNFLFVLNDDVVFLTHGWDKIILEETKYIRDDIYYIGCNDTSMDKGGNKEYSSFPILSRAAYETLGHFISDKLVGLGGDVYLYRIFKEISRIKKVPVLLNHTRHNTYEKVINPDKTAQNMRINSQNNYIDCFTMDISEEIEKLQNK